MSRTPSGSTSDNGAGFDPEQVNGGYGLRGMRSAESSRWAASLLVRARPAPAPPVSVEVPG